MKKLYYLLVVLLIVSVMSFTAFSYENYDFEGEVITIAGYLAGWGYNFNMGADLERLEETEKRFNVEIEIRDDGDYSWPTDMTRDSVLAGDVPYDVAFMQAHWLYDEDVIDFLLPLDDYLDQDFFDRIPDVGMTDIDQQIRHRGNMVALSQPGQRLLWAQVVWNKELFEEYNLPDLYEIYQEGNWTWERFRDIARKATQDTTGDGQTDIWGVGRHFWNWNTSWLRTNNAQAISTENGRMVFTGNEPNFIEGLEYWQEIVGEGLVIMDIHEAIDTWKEGRVAMKLCHGVTYADPEFGVVPLPKGPQADEHKSFTHMTHVMVFPLTLEKDPRAIVEVLMSMYGLAEPYIDKEEYEEQYWDNWAAETGYGQALSDYESFLVMQWGLQNAQWDLHKDMLPGTFYDALMDITRGDQSAQMLMDAFAPEWQAYLDDTFN